MTSRYVFFQCLRFAFSFSFLHSWNKVLLSHCTYEMAQFPITYRVTRIPEHVGREEFDVAIRKSMRLYRPSDLTLHSFSTDRSDSYRPTNRTATISINTKSSRLPDEDSTDNYPITLDIAGGLEITVYIDAHFEGFSPLSPITPVNKNSIE